MTQSVLDFYEGLAPYYHLIFDEWRHSSQRQAAQLDAIIRRRIGKAPDATTVHDCSCGIGTQALGLAEHGYHVHATDLSPSAIERARKTASELRLDVTFATADFRRLADQVDGTFDVVLTCDNSLPHLLTDDELHQGLASMYAKVMPDGIVLISLRDYDIDLQTRPRTTPVRLIEDAQGRRMVFQMWDWDTIEPIYTVNHFILTEDTLAQWETIHHTTQYRALTRQELDALLYAVGFDNVRWHMPADSGYYQPIVTARKPASGDS